MSAINVTGYTAVMQLRTAAQNSVGSLLYTLSTSGGQITIPVGTDGTFVLTVPAATTATFNFQQAYYDLIITSPAGKVTKLIRGLITVNPSVSV